MTLKCSFSTFRQLSSCAIHFSMNQCLIAERDIPYDEIIPSK